MTRPSLVGWRALATATVAAVLVAGAAPASARDGAADLQVDGPAGVLPGADPPPGVGLSRAVEALPLVSAELDAARAELASVLGRQRADTGRVAELIPQIAALSVETVALRGLVDRRDARTAKLAEAQRASRSALSGVAVEWFITGFGALEGLDPALTAEERDRLAHQHVLSEAGAYAALDGERNLASRLSALREERDELERLLAARVARTEELRSEAVRLGRALEDAARRIPELEVRVTRAAMGARVAGTDLSATALDAYWRAERTMASRDPSCGVAWWVLAGIGYVESYHGTYRGSRLDVDGRVDPPVFGPPLDGTYGFAIVPDSDGGAIDGTAATDRATGPMQFLPGTWRMVGTDGTGNGVADPQNLFDAAASAGVYLCRSGPGLAGEERLRAALFTYNRSTAYVEEVLRRGRGYLGAVGLGR